MSWPRVRLRSAGPTLASRANYGSDGIADCRTGALRESNSIGLSPGQEDTFPFQQALMHSARDFFQANRGLLSP